MQYSRNPVHGLTAADVMVRVPVVISHRMSMRAAARLLSRQRSCKAAVVDACGRCVGVLTAAGILRWVGNDEREDGVPPDCIWCDWQVVDLKPTGKDEVRRYMTVDPALVAPETRLAEVAQLLLGERKPCVIVVDRQRRPIGIVPRSDLLAAATWADRRKGEQNCADNAVTNRRIETGEPTPSSGQVQPCS